jgi:hypothetical protein
VDPGSARVAESGRARQTSGIEAGMPELSYTCDACGQTVRHDPSRGHVPPGWAFRRVAGRVLTFCDSDDLGWNHRDGLAPWLKAQLKARGIDTNER